MTCLYHPLTDILSLIMYLSYHSNLITLLLHSSSHRVKITSITQRRCLNNPMTFYAIYVLVVSLVALTVAAPFSSSIFTEYIYKYEANINPGFTFKTKAHLELVHSNGDRLFRLRLTEPTFYAQASNDQSNQKALILDSRNSNHDLYAHIVTHSNGTAYVKELYTHESDTVTFKNIKKSILLNLIPTTSHHSAVTTSPSTFKTDNNDAQPELFSPDSISQVKIVCKVRKPPAGDAESTTLSNSIDRSTYVPPTIYKLVEGYQNVTFKSRVFAEAESNLTTSFQLELIEELKSTTHEKFDEAESVAGAIKLLDGKLYQQSGIELEREKRNCLHHHCGKNLPQLIRDHESHLADEALASVPAAISYLRLLEGLRLAEGTSIDELLALLKKMRGNDGVKSSFLDILAAARTKNSIIAALKYLKLPRNSDLDTAERFLTVLSVSAKTSSKMHLKRSLQSPYYFTPTPSLRRSHKAKQVLAQEASLEFIAKELLKILKQVPDEKWESHKLRWSTLLTLATIVNANNQEHNFEQLEDKLHLDVSVLLLDQLEACEHHQFDTDCRIVVLQAMGNVGTLGEAQFEALQTHILGSGKRESIAAMKVLKDLLQNQAKDKQFTRDFYENLRKLLCRVVYDSRQETTARVLAAELKVRFIPNSHLAANHIVETLPNFGNTELATMIYSRIQSIKPETPKHHQNWHWIANIINGTSTSFVRTMAETKAMNASYGVNVELMDKAKILKESSFDVFLDTKKQTQDLFSLGIFTRGISGSFFGGGDDSEDSKESTTAGMTLRILGGYLRPYIFFSSMGELTGHVWAGTASQPTTAFNGNLLLIDHEEGIPLISGFVAEQQMRGVLSIDVTGEVSVSLWNRKANALVRTKAAVIVQASQSVFTSYDNFWHSHLFSFGGQASIDFITESLFKSKPFTLCLQVTQPDFVIRYHSRKVDQMLTNEVKRRVTRTTRVIGGHSYPLNAENNKMCSIMEQER